MELISYLEVIHVICVVGMLHFWTQMYKSEEDS
jgi:hypothetical protein